MLHSRPGHHLFSPHSPPHKAKDAQLDVPLPNPLELIGHLNTNRLLNSKSQRLVEMKQEHGTEVPAKGQQRIWNGTLRVLVCREFFTITVHNDSSVSAFLPLLWKWLEMRLDSNLTPLSTDHEELVCRD